jgi:hypothetical protein
MSDTPDRASLAVVHPQTSEILDVKTEPTNVLADLHESFMAHERDLKSYRRTVDDELVERMDHEGVRTFHGDGFTIEVGKPTEREWNLDLLLETLDRLVSDGIISSRKAEKCVKIEQKVVAVEVRPLESDPRTQRQIAACYREVAARRSVKVRS